MPTAQTAPGWSHLVDDPLLFARGGHFSVAAYSEMMPAPWVGMKPSGAPDLSVRDPDDDHGFLISEYQQRHQLTPGLTRLATHLIEVNRKLARGEHALSRSLLIDNPWWPDELATRAGTLAHERFLLLLPLALSRTLDDKGRVRWTLFGSSEQGPSRPFWKSFYRAPGEELPEAAALLFFRDVFARVYDTDVRSFHDLRAAGFRILPSQPRGPAPTARHDGLFDFWSDDPLPSWTKPFLLDEATLDEPASTPSAAADPVRHLLTFRPFARLPASVREAYFAGRLHLWPFPGSLAFFGHAGYRKLSRQLPMAMQIPLLHVFPRDPAPTAGIRIPQSGWLDEPRPGLGLRADKVHTHGRIVNFVQRTHRWNRTFRDDDETALLDVQDRVSHALFANSPERLGLYGKPMARNAQIWTDDHRLLLDGPVMSRRRLDEAARAIEVGGHFGYRFFFPPMRAGEHALYWHLPLAACVRDSAPVLLEGLSGYLTAYDEPSGRRAPLGPGAAELWPRLLDRAPHLDAAELFERDAGRRRHQTSYNVRKLLEAQTLVGDQPLRRSFARRLLTTARERSLDAWIDRLPSLASDPARGERLAETLRGLLAKEDPPLDAHHDDARSAAPAHAASRVPLAWTFEETARRDFEEKYWRQIAFLCEGGFVAKDNADYADSGAPSEPPGAPSEPPGAPSEPPGAPSEPPGAPRLVDNPLPAAAAGGLALVASRAANDLEALGDYLHSRYRALIAESGLVGKALVADHRFRWRTDFDFPWMGGWLKNQTGQARERNIVMIIPGKNRGEAIIMGDHYDTAYMEDVYDKARGGDGTRRAAAGADDNHSATAALLLAAEVLLPLSRAGKLERDVWLVHLTGEEFPADCLGARNLVERLVERSFAVVADGAGHVDLSSVRVRGAFVLDMVAHNNDHERNVFQIAPGEGPAAARLAELAHLAAERWNASVDTWNAADPRRRAPGPSARMPDGSHPPPVVAHPRLDGEVRPGWHFKSSLYNTDAQIFSDAGIPVVLFMENYDINRAGYHDSHDTMANIDLDYGAALVAIAIESVCAAAIAD